MLKEFKNGNIHIKFNSDELEYDVFETLYEGYDIYPVTNPYSISNFAMASDFSYNGGSAYYRITSYDLDNLKAGKTVILQPLSEDYIKENQLDDEF